MGIIEAALLGAVIGGIAGAVLHFLRKRRAATADTNPAAKRGGGD